MFCKKCGKQLPEGASFCTACGEPAATEKGKEKGAPPAPPLPAESIAAQNAPSPQDVPVRTSVLVNGALQKQLLASNLVLVIVETVPTAPNTALQVAGARLRESEKIKNFCH